MPTRSNNQKPQILQAALGVVASSGASHLTIDAVAAAADMSKGGVLYHFPNKQALLTGMLQNLLERMVPTSDGQPQRLLEHIERERTQTPELQAASAAILAAASEDPSLLDPARAILGEVFADAREGFADGELAQILLLATEGLRLLRVLDLWPQDEAVSDALHKRLSGLASDLALAESP